jgi:hypothetical protein
MAKRKRNTTKATIKNRIKQGRGAGRLAEYKPWLHIQDVPSRGLASRVSGWKTNRVHHFLSLLELYYFFVFEWALVVVDIREQYALLPLEETLDIAKKCGIHHPYDPKTKHPVVMTTDFVNTVRRGPQDLDEPCTVKYSGDLISRRTLEKLEIERRYWECRKMKLKILTESNVPKVLAKNVQWVHAYRCLQDFTELDELTFSLIASNLIAALRKQAAPLSQITLSLDDQLGLEVGTCLSIVRHLISNRHLRVDMLKAINPREPLSLLK